jgi:hypothetical protein
MVWYGSGNLLLRAVLSLRPWRPKERQNLAGSTAKKIPQPQWPKSGITNINPLNSTKRSFQLPSSTTSSSILCWIALVIWIVGAAVIGWFFVKGVTSPSADGRTAVLLKPAERDFILTEMRQLLQAVHGVVTGVSHPDQAEGYAQAVLAARSAGMEMAADDNPALLLKLPLPMKQLGMSVHRDFDEMADAISAGATSQDILQRLSSITNRCVTCHEMYQLQEG